MKNILQHIYKIACALLIMACGLAPGEVWGQTCKTICSTILDVSVAQDTVLNARDTIFTSSTVTAPNSAMFRAGESVFLRDGFHIDSENSHMQAQSGIYFTASQKSSDAFIDLEWKVQTRYMDLPDNGTLYISLRDYATQEELHFQEIFVHDVQENKALEGSYRHYIGQDQQVKYELNVLLQGLGNPVIPALVSNGVSAPYWAPGVAVSQSEWPDRVKISISNHSDMVTEYRIKRDGQLIALLNGIDTVYEDTYSFTSPNSLVNGQAYEYCITPYSDIFEEFFADICNPGNTLAMEVQATDNAFADQVDITWQDMAGYADVIEITRDGEKIMELPNGSTLFTDAMPTYGKVHTYGVILVKNGKKIVGAYDQGSTAPNGSITGRITSAEGSFSTANVQVIASTEVNGIVEGDTTYTDATGHYTFADLFYGENTTYQVEATLEGHTFANNPQNLAFNRINHTFTGVDFRDNHSYEDGEPSFTFSELVVTAQQAADYIQLDWNYTPAHPDDTLYFQLFRKTTGENDSTLIDLLTDEGNTLNQYQDLSGIPGTGYTYTVQAYAYQSDTVSTISLSGSAIYPIATVAAQNFTVAANNTLGIVDLSWSHTSQNFTGFELYRDDELIAVIDKEATLAYEDKGGHPGASHTYKIIAFVVKEGVTYQSAGTSANVVNYPVLPQVTSPVATPAPDADKMTVTWSYPAVDTDYNYDGVFIYRDNEQIGEVLKDFPASFEDKTGVPNSNYTYSLHTFKYNSGADDEASGVETIAAYPSVKAPANLLASDNSQIGYATLEWSHSSANHDGFVILRDTDTVAVVAKGIRTHKDPVPGSANPVQYTYTIKSFRQIAGVKYYSASSQDTGSAQGDGGVDFPEVPDHFTASEGLSGHILLQWEYPEYILSTFDIYRDGILLETLPTDNRVYYDYTAQPNTMYIYQIQAFNNGDSSYMVGDAGSLGSVNTISGTVINETSGMGVPDITVAATAQIDGDQYIKTATTDASGFYQIEEAPNRAGTVVTVTASGQNHIPAPGQMDVNIEAGKNLYIVNFTDTYAQSVPVTDSVAVPIDVTAVSDPVAQHVTIRWNVSSANYSGFKIYRGLVELADISAQHHRVVIDNGGFPGHDYSYRVQAYWYTATGTKKSDFVADVATYPVIPAAEHLKLTQLEEEDMVRISWSHPSDKHDYYEIKRADEVLGIVPAGEELLFEDTTGIPGQLYNYTVTAAKNTVQGLFTSQPVNAQISYPFVSPVMQLQATIPGDQNYISLSWQHASDHHDGYLVERDGIPINTLDKEIATMNDSEGIPNVLQEYRVITYVVKEGIRYESVPVKVDVDYPAIRFVENLQATPDAILGQIQLAWGYSPVDVTGYDIYRDNALIATLSDPQVTSFTDRTGIPDSSYTYEVIAFDLRDEQKYVAANVTVNETYPKVPVPTAVVASDEIDINYIKVTWDYEALNNDGFYVYRDNQQVTELTAGRRSFKELFNQNGVANGTYTLKAFRTIDNIEYLSDLSASDVGSTASNTASGDLNDVLASKGLHSNKVSLSWEYSGQNATDVMIYRDGEHLATVAAGSEIYNDADGIPGKRYVYQVALADDDAKADMGYRRANGSIVGSVITQEGAIGVPGVPVTATASIEGERYTYTENTNASGEFEILGVYYKEATDYTVSVAYPGHSFVEDTLETALTLDINNTHVEPFIDQTAYVFNGMVRRGTVCGIDSVKVVLTTVRNGQELIEETFTDATGQYSFTINPQDQEISEYQLRVASEKTFTEENEQDTTYLHFANPEVSFARAAINELVTLVDFEDTVKYPVELIVQNTCGPVGNNQFDVRVTSSDGCFAQTYRTLDNGKLVVDLPPLNYELVVTGVANPNPQTLAVVDYLRVRPIRLDLFEEVHHPVEKGDAILEDLMVQGYLEVAFTFHKAPKITVTGIDSYLCDDPELPAVIDQDEQYTLNLNVFESHDELCPVNEGYVVVKNAAAANTTPVRIDYDTDLGGFPSYTFVAGEPITVSPYILGMVVEYHTENGGYQGEAIQQIIVEGEKSPPGNDIIVSVDQNTIQLPLFVLRDPPGDQSYSYIEEGKTFNKKLSVKDLNSGGGGTKIEQQAAVGGLGNFGQYVFNAGGGGGQSATFNVSITTTQRIATAAANQSKFVKGEQADVIVGTGVSTAYGITERIEVNENCEIVKSSAIQLAPDGLTTQWQYTVFQIEKLIKEYERQLEEIQAGTLTIEGLEDGESPEAYINVLRDNWKAMLDYHREEAVPMCQVCDLENLPRVFANALSNMDEYTSFCNQLGGFGVCDLEGFIWTDELMEQYNTLNQFRADLDDYIAYGYKSANGIIDLDNDDGLIITEAMLNNVGLESEYQQLYGPEVNNITFDGATGAISKEVTVARSQSRGITQKTYFNMETYLGLMYNIEITISKGMGISVTTTPEVDGDNKVGITAEYHFEFEKSKENSEEHTATVGYVLDDDDAGDQFSITVVKGVDPSHTPYFSLLGGRSACPAEPGTISRFDPQLFVVLPDGSLTKEATLFDVDPEGPASFQLQMNSGNLFDENLLHYLYAPTEFTDFVPNQNDAEIALQTGAENDGTGTRFIAPGAPEYTQVDIFRREGDVYDYTDIMLSLAPKCEENFNTVSDFVFLKVHFKRPCSPVSLLVDGNRDPFGNGTTDGDQWVINKAPQNEREQLFLKLVDYDPENVPMEDITLQYRRLGSNNWFDIDVIEKDTLAVYFEEFKATYPNPTYPYVWDITDLDMEDGKYEVRALSFCGPSGENYSNVLTGTIDRTSMQVFGQPEPADGILSLGDEISVTFNEMIDCALFNPADVSLVNASAGNSAVGFMVSCLDNRLALVVTDDLALLEGDTLTVTVNHVVDAYGNALENPVSWSFAVHHNPVYWYPNSLSAQVLQGTTTTLTGRLFNTSEAELAYTLSGHELSWLSVSAPQGSVAPFGTDFSFVVDATDLSVGNYQVAIDANVAGFTAETLTLDVDVLPQGPGWFVDRALYEDNMSMVVNFNLNNTGLSTDTLDLISVWIGNSLRGVANVQKVTNDDYVAYLSISGNSTDNGEALSFRVWDASTGFEYDGHANQVYTYSKDTYYGTTVNPVVLTVDDSTDHARYVSLKSGWNWISFNTEQDDMSVNDMLKSLEVSEGDQIKNQTQTSIYSAQNGWESLDGLDSLNTEEGYMLKLAAAGTLRLTGSDAAITNIVLQAGWNLIGYQPQEAQSLDDALTNLNAVSGDLLKSEIGFAEYDQGESSWFGMEAMAPNKAYMLYASAPKALQFSSGRTTGSDTGMEMQVGDWYVNSAEYEYNMTITGTVAFTEGTVPGYAVVGAFVGGECRGIGELRYHKASDQYLVSVFVYANDEGEAITFKVMDQDDIGESTEMMNTLTFHSNNHEGKIAEPYLFQNDLFAGEGKLMLSPNPFVEQTQIGYTVAADNSPVTIRLYDVNGILVKELMKEESHTAGRYEMPLKASDLSTQGIYVCKVQIGEHVYAEKVVMQR